MSKKILLICFVLGMFMLVPAGALAASASDVDSPSTTIAGDVNDEAPSMSLTLIP